MKMSVKAAGVIACICLAVLIGMPMAVQAVTGNFSVSIDGGEAINQAEDFHEFNADGFEFSHLNNTFSVSYRHSVFYSNDGGVNYQNLATDVAGNVVAFSDYYQGEGIYRIGMQGLDQFNSPDSGYFNNLIQTTKSVVMVDAVVNDPDTIVENPEVVVVGRDEADVYGDYSYYWEILDSEGTVVLSGTDVQPDMAAIYALPDGTYLVRNTVAEPIAAEFGGGFVTDTTEGAFILAGSNDPVTPEAPAEAEVSDGVSSGNSGILPETGTGVSELIVLGGFLSAGALMVLKKISE